MSTVKANNVQVGQSGTATNNFTLYQPSSPDGTVRLAVGNSGATSADVLTANSSGNVGIGTSSPLARLTVSDSTATNGTMTLGNNGSYYGGLQYTFSTGELRISQVGGASLGTTFYTNGSERMRIDSSGNVLVGTTTSPSGSGNISINNGIYSVGVYNNSSGQAANLGIDATNKNFYRSTSSIKYKREVQDAVHGLSELLRLRPVTYKGKSPTDGERVFGGLIAEEVHDAGLTEFVQYSADNEPDALAYGNMVSLCVKAIQELKAIVDAQAARISALEAA